MNSDSPSSFSSSLSPQAGMPGPHSVGPKAWLRRYRRYLPIPLCLVALVWLQPQLPWGSAWLDTLTDWVGVGLGACGQGLRLWAWGSNADVGKFGVRARGPYTMVRHPLYTGNFLIVFGLVVIFNNPWAYPLFLLPFASLYYVVTDMEEKRMHRRFGVDYQGYTAASVPRFWPALRNLKSALQTTPPFGWGLAWRKEYESCCGWLAGVIGLQVYEDVLLHGWAENWPHTQTGVAMLGLIGIVALGLRIHKSATRKEKS